MGRRRFDVDPDSDPNLHLDADPDLDPTSSFTQAENPKFVTTFIHAMSVYIVILISVQGVKIFNILDNILKFSGKKYSLSLHLLEMDTDPDPAKR